eukprot:431434-Prymnesium_polylepis.1
MDRSSASHRSSACAVCCNSQGPDDYSHLQLGEHAPVLFGPCPRAPFSLRVPHRSVCAPPEPLGLACVGLKIGPRVFRRSPLGLCDYLSAVRDMYKRRGVMGRGGGRGRGEMPLHDLHCDSDARFCGYRCTCSVGHVLVSGWRAATSRQRRCYQVEGRAGTLRHGTLLQTLD